MNGIGRWGEIWIDNGSRVGSAGIEGIKVRLNSVDNMAGLVVVADLSSAFLVVVLLEAMILIQPASTTECSGCNAERRSYDFTHQDKVPGRNTGALLHNRTVYYKRTAVSGLVHRNLG